MGKISSYPYNPSGTDTKSIGGVMSIFDAFKAVINGELDSENLATGAVGTDEIQDDAVGTDEIQDDAVTDAKVAKPVIAGAIKSDGTVEEGTGFTAKKTATGQYEITLTEELPTKGVIVATSSQLNDLPRIAERGKKVFKVHFVTLDEDGQDTAFNFLIKAT